MKYENLIESVNKCEEEFELTECIYFGAIEKLRNVQKNLGKIDDIRHVRRVIKPFLIQWGMMNRVAGQKNLEWKKLGETLRKLEKEFAKLRGKRFLNIKFNDENVSSAIKNIYRKIDLIPQLGGRTCEPKILHLLNPEIFVMWDEAIEKNYKRKNSRIRDSPEGYLEFLKEAQKELREALEDHQKETGKGLDEIEEEIQHKYKNKTLARIIDEYNWTVAHPFIED